VAALLDAAQIGADLRGEHLRHRERRGDLGQVAQHANLAVRRLRLCRAIHDLQNELAAVGGANLKITVSLARQRFHRHR
jgi:hypothetical protein